MCLKIPIIFHDGSNYDYHFALKKLLVELKNQFTCLGENTEKYITFTVSIEKEVTKVNKSQEEVARNICSILQFIDSPRFMVSSLSIIINNLSEVIRRIKCKYRQVDEKMSNCRIRYKYCDSVLECINVKMI